MHPAAPGTPCGEPTPASRIFNSLLFSCLEQNGREAILSFPGDCRDRATPACWLSRGVPFTSIDYLPGGREMEAVST